MGREIKGLAIMEMQQSNKATKAVRVAERVHKALKLMAADEGKSVADLVNELLTDSLGMYLDMSFHKSVLEAKRNSNAVLRR